MSQAFDSLKVVEGVIFSPANPANIHRIGVSWEVVREFNKRHWVIYRSMVNFPGKIVLAKKSDNIFYGILDDPNDDHTYNELFKLILVEWELDKHAG